MSLFSAPHRFTMTNIHGTGSAEFDMMRCSFAVASLLVFGWLNSGTPAQADTCSDLWSSRNEVYKALGYCFTTRRAIRAFGNAGCEYDNIEDVPLNPEQRRMVSALLREERALGCPR